jgi:alpha-tubulin suppressor-like RCC1 family protein
VTSTGMPVDARPERQPTTKSYGWGYNNYGGLGAGHMARVLSPTRVGLPAGTVDAQGGTDFTVALTDAGQVFTWGGNRWGQLGDGTTRHRFAPYQVVLRGRPHIVAIAVGDDHVVALSKGGLVYGWGRNDLGQVGSGPLADRVLRPAAVKVPGNGKVVRIAAGNACSFAIRTTGALYAWGHPTPLGNTVPTGGLGATRGGVGAVAQPVRLTLPGGARAELVDAGQRHLVVVTRDGDLLTFGVNAFGRAMPQKLSLHRSWGRVSSLSAGDNHTLALTTRGAVLAWGLNRFGQLGTGDTSHHEEPVKVVVPGFSGRVVQVLAGGDSSYLRAPDRVYAWGHSGWGQHGTGGTADVLRARRIPMPDHVKLIGLHIGRYHSFATLTSVGR